MRRSLLSLLLYMAVAPAAFADSPVPSMTASGTIVGGQLLYCPTTTPADFKCTFTQVDAFINAQFSGAFTVGSTGVATLAAVPISGLSGLGTGVATALGVNVGTAGAFIVNGGVLGTPSSGTLTNATGLPIAGITGLGTGVATALAANVNGSGAISLTTSPTFVTPVLGTPTSVTLTNGTGLPIATGVSGLGTGVATALAVNVGTAGSPIVNGGALGTPSSGTLTNATGLPISSGVAGLGTTVATTLGNAVNAASGAPNVSGAIVTGNCLKWGPGIQDAGGACTTTGAGISFPQTIAGTVTSGGIPYFSNTTTMTTSALLAANAIMVGGGVGASPATVTTGSGAITALGVNVGTAGAFVTNGGALGTPSSGTLTSATGLPVATGISGLGTGVATALAVNVGTAGSPVVNGGALGTPSSGTLTSATGLPIATGISGLGTGVATAAAANTNSAAGLATAAAPLTAGGTGSLTGAFGYYICTGTCTITLPTPAAGFQFCVRNDDNIATVITIAAISSVLFEKTTYNGYGTVSTGTMVSAGALGDKICLIGRDATHYLVGSFIGTWTNS